VSHPLLTAPIGRSLLLLAGPTTALMLMQILVAVQAWSRLFTSDDQVAAASMSYIRHVAPFYCLFGLGISLNFASQGAGRMTAPLIASFARMIAATIAGWIVVEKTNLGLDGMFSAIAFGIVVYGCWIAASLFVGPWCEKGQLIPSNGR
jgi:Na+-driven multidrug efflux pump